MREWLGCIILIMAVFDISATWYFVKKTNNTLCEMNPNVRFFWNKFGVDNGTLYFGIISLALMFGLILFVQEWALKVIIGMYIVVCYIHLNNLDAVSKRGNTCLSCGRKFKEEQNGKRMSE